MNGQPERKTGLDLAGLMSRIFDAGFDKQTRTMKLLRVLEDDENILDFIVKCLFDPRFTAKDEAIKTLLTMNLDKTFSTFFSFLDQFAARTRERFLPALSEPQTMKAIFRRILDLSARPGSDAASERNKLVALLGDLPREKLLYGLICSQDWDAEPSSDLFKILTSAGKDALWNFINLHKNLGDPIFLVRAAKALGAIGMSSKALELMYLLPPELSESFSCVPHESRAVPLKAEVGGAFFMSGDIVFREGEAGNACYIVKSGRVRVCKTDRDGNEITLAHLGVKEIFGEMAIIDNTPRSATVVAAEDTMLLTVNEENFEKVFIKNPEFSLKMLKILVNRLRKSSEIIKELEDRLSSGNK